ncbi:MAG TPA: hypothetical protein PKC45_01670 [Gemmatales bacterium]|nr:hypothetical protein [Gemmatales bacterium]
MRPHGKRSAAEELTNDGVDLGGGIFKDEMASLLEHMHLGARPAPPPFV